MTVFLGTLWCPIKKIEAPYIFAWEYRIALHAMQGNRASSPAEGIVPWEFPSCGSNWGIFSSYNGDGHSKLHFVQQSLEDCLVMTDNSGI